MEETVWWQGRVKAFLEHLKIYTKYKKFAFDEYGEYCGNQF